MIALAHPWVLALLPVPLALRWVLPPHREPRPAVIVPFLARLSGQSGQRPGEGAVAPMGGRVRAVSLWATWACACLAMSRPQVIEPPITRSVPTRDVLLAVDLSGSMETRDFADARGQKVQRLAAVKEVLDDFLSKREGDRVGLIFFGSAPFVQAPFTEDLHVCRQLLDEAQVRMAGPQTAFGDALGLAITVFGRSPTKEKVLIALTDGNDTASRMPPAKAAEVARDKGITIHTISVGDPTAVGEDALDVEALKNVSRTTGGTYAHAADRPQLDAIYARLDQLEPHTSGTLIHRPRRDVYWWPLAAGLVVTAIQQGARLLRAGGAHRRAADPEIQAIARRTTA